MTQGDAESVQCTYAEMSMVIAGHNLLCRESTSLVITSN